VAAAGYIAIAPDFLSGAGPKGGGTGDFSSQDELALALKGTPGNWGVRSQRRIETEIEAAVNTIYNTSHENLSVGSITWLL
jgi:dienelactone hydrolase